MNVFLIALIISIISYLAIGWYAGRKVKNLEDYYVAGRNASSLLIIGTLVASFMSTNAFLGEMGMSYQGHGPLIVIMTGVNCMGYIIGALFFGRYLRRSRALTVPEFFGRRFGSRRLQSLAGLTIVIGLTCYLMAVTWGVSLIVTKVTDMPSWASIVLVWFGYTGFTLYSGSRGVVLTDTAMFLLFSTVALVALYYIIQSGGGWFSSLEQLALYEDKPELISWHGVVGDNSNWKTPLDGLIWALILGVAWGIVVAVSPWQTSRYLMAKDEHVVIRSACGASIAMFLLYLINSYAAAAVNLSNPSIDPPESVMIWVAMNLMPTVLGALLVCGILAAGLSSASTFLSLIGFSSTNDIFKHDNDADRQLKSTRYTIIFVGVAVVLLCLILPSNIFWITYFAGPVFASSWGVVAFMSVWSKSITESGAFWGMLSGFFGNITANLIQVFGDIKLPVYLDPILVGSAISLFTVIMISSLGQVKPVSEAFRKKLHQMPENMNNKAEIARTLLWPKAMIVLGILVMVLMVNFYAIPYDNSVTKKTLMEFTP